MRSGSRPNGRVIRELSQKLRRTRETIVRSTRELRVTCETLTTSASQFQIELHAMWAILRRSASDAHIDAAVDGERSVSRTDARSTALSHPHLTAREREVMNLVIAGKTSKEIAVALGLAVRTVDGYRGRIFEKMGVRSAPRLIAAVLDSVVSRR